MTLTQLGAFVLVARLGSVTAAAAALGVSEPAVSQALAALRRHFGDPLIVRGESGMTLTPGGRRLFGIAAQMVGLGAEAESVVRAARGAPEQLRLVGPSAVVEFVAGPLSAAWAGRGGALADLQAGVATTREAGVLVAQRLADVALGPPPAVEDLAALDVEPVLRCRLVVLGPRGDPPAGPPARWRWCVDPSGTDPDSDVAALLRALRVPERRLSVYPNQTAAWEAAAHGGGVAPGLAHLAARHTASGELRVLDVPGTPVDLVWHVTTLAAGRRSAAASALRRFLVGPQAVHLLRAPGAGVPPSRFRPPVHVTIWDARV